jgi:hypothetical protein
MRHPTSNTGYAHARLGPLSRGLRAEAVNSGTIHLIVLQDNSFVPEASFRHEQEIARSGRAWAGLVTAQID